MHTMAEPPERPDPELVALAQGGDQAAYGRLVARHQVLVVSVAYSVCGDFAGSQDIAQEAFVAAWRQLGTLDDFTKFKAWVCGIARNLSNSFVRRETARLERETGSLDGAPESGAEIPGPREATVSREEAALVWAALEALPEAYREPLILYYREQQSIERVAAAMDLSVDNVKQRLSRGRAMVREQVEGVVARSLGRTIPGATFTAYVLAALPVAGLPVAAGSSAATAGKGVAAAKGVLVLPWSWFALAAVSLLQLFAVFFSRRSMLRKARSPAERTFVKRNHLIFIAFLVLHPTIIVGLIEGLESLADTLYGMGFHHLMGPYVFMEGLLFGGGFTRWMSAWLCLYWGAAAVWLLWSVPLMRELVWRVQPQAQPTRWQKLFGNRTGVGAWVYRSPLTLLGLPLLDIRFGHSKEEPSVRGVARGWIALGDRAHGVVFAMGGFAVGGIAFGGCAIGLVSLGFASVGVVAIGTLGVAVGGLACGSMVSIGYVALPQSVVASWAVVPQCGALLGGDLQKMMSFANSSWAIEHRTIVYAVLKVRLWSLETSSSWASAVCNLTLILAGLIYPALSFMFRWRRGAWNISATGDVVGPMTAAAIPSEGALAFLHRRWMYLGLALLALHAAVVSGEVARDALAKEERARSWDEAFGLYVKDSKAIKSRLDALRSDLPAGVASLLASVAADPGFKLVPIPAGQFRMGMPPNEEDNMYHWNEIIPSTLVTLTKDFFLGTTDVTQGQYVALMGSGGNPASARPLAPDMPIDNVTWDEAMAYCQKLTAREQAAGRLPAGWRFTLPTEAQWEFACRAGGFQDFPDEHYGDDDARKLGARAWYRANSGGQPHPVATKDPNNWGLYDMRGNVPGWCLDWYGPYPDGAVTDPTGPATGTERVIRGGSWAADAAECGSAFRAKSKPEIGGAGFRVALVESP